ncbi:MAG TPA: hypothetical protein VEK79_06510 [Thermoanaerobaculia bacterium]|nr:hypothetical protein [Thermoanaerobaculia bacterium]
MPAQITLPDDLIAEINAVTNDPAAFIANAVRLALRSHRGDRKNKSSVEGSADDPEISTLT